jgi:hypothetical protein
MATADTTEPTTTDIAILARILSNGKAFTPALARHLLKLGFSPEDKARMHDLAVRNQSGLLTPEELEELRSYASAGCLLGILQSKARQSLRHVARK